MPKGLPPLAARAEPARRRSSSTTKRRKTTARKRTGPGGGKAARGRALLKAIAKNPRMTPAAKAKARATIRRKFGC